MIYHRQEKHDLAEYHFQKAVHINSTSPVLLCYLGMEQHAQKKSAAALASLNKVRSCPIVQTSDSLPHLHLLCSCTRCCSQALSLDPRNPLAKFNKAMIEFTLGHYQQALDELEPLKEIAPRESSVYFLMGRIYKKVGLLCGGGPE